MKQTLKILILLFALGFLLRAAALVFYFGTNSPLEGDSIDYHNIAVSFLEGRGWQANGAYSYRSPLISLQLAAIYAVAGPSIALARWSMVFVSALIAPALFLVAQTLLRGKQRIAFLVALAWCFYPPAIWYGAQVMTENMAALLMVLGLGSYLWAAKSKRWEYALAAGALWGLAVLNRAFFVFLPLALLLSYVIPARLGGWRWNWKQWAIALAALVAVLTPWTMRNYIVHGAFIPTTTQGAFYLGVTNGSLGHPDVQAGKYYKNPELYALIQGQPEAKWGAIGAKFAKDHLGENLDKLPKVLFNRAKNFWTPRPDPYDPLLTRNDLIMYLVWTPILLLFVLSFARYSWREDLPSLIMIGYAFAITVVFWGTPRFRFPVDALIMIRAMGGAMGMAMWLEKRWPPVKRFFLTRSC